ncbi:hypothetical protein LguiA_000737 [Lonicera macranthoides]
MISTWRRRRAARHASKNQDSEEIYSSTMELTVPDHFRCPISLDLMKDPVTLSTGITYDRQSIETWIEAGNKTCPFTNQTLTNLEPIPNHTIRKMIQNWCVDNHSYGIERIPTPRIPVSSYQVSDILSKIVAAGKRNDSEACRNLVVKIKAMGKESERNKKCIASSGGSTVLSAIFEAFSEEMGVNGVVLEEILSALTMLRPIEGEGKVYLGSGSSLNSIVWFLKCGDLSSQRNAVLVLKEILSSDQRKVEEVAEIEGALQALVKVIKEPICPTTTKASLLAIYHMVSNEKLKARFVELGLVEMLLQTIVDSDRSIIEKALGVLDGICGCEQAREKAFSDALTMPVLVKNMLRVSELATDFSVSIIWRLSKNETREDGGVIVEALQVGAFQKLLLLLQVGCGERTKDKATELLKLMNLHRKRLECIDSMDFKNIKRPS